jgi:hypothetical protein
METGTRELLRGGGRKKNFQKKLVRASLLPRQVRISLLRKKNFNLKMMSETDSVHRFKFPREISSWHL